jgi:molecular chaperone GrpE
LVLLEQTIRLNTEESRSQQEAFVLELLEIFDALESLNRCLEEVTPSPNAIKRLPKSLKSIQSKLLAVLSQQNVNLIQYEGNTPDYEICNSMFKFFEFEG